VDLDSGRVRPLTEAGSVLTAGPPGSSRHAPLLASDAVDR
jgi:hypothetical protein